MQSKITELSEQQQRLLTDVIRLTGFQDQDSFNYWVGLFNKIVFTNRWAEKLQSIIWDIDNNKDNADLNIPWGIAENFRTPAKNINTVRTAEDVRGYYEALDSILHIDLSNRYGLTEDIIKKLHATVLKYSNNKHHAGLYRTNVSDMWIKHPHPDQKKLVLQTAPPSIISHQMKCLLAWLNKSLLMNNTHPLIVISLFLYEFISIHPFVDGNGRTYRVLATLLLLKSGYNFIQYSSFESYIEDNRVFQYKVLVDALTQRGTSNEKIHNWALFLLMGFRSLTNGRTLKIESGIHN